MNYFSDSWFENLQEHNWVKVGLIFANLLIYVAMLGFNAAASFSESGNSNSILALKKVYLIN